MLKTMLIINTLYNRKVNVETLHSSLHVSGTIGAAKKLECFWIFNFNDLLQSTDN